MSAFDPLQERKRLQDRGIARELDKQVETFAADAAIGSSARRMLDNTVYGWIVGLRAEMQPVLLKAREWLEASIAKGEAFGDPPAYFAMLREAAHALALWMIEGRSDRAAWLGILDLHEKAWAEIRAKRAFPDSEALEDYAGPYLRDCIQAQAWERGTAAYESFGGKKITDAAEIRSEAEFGYWACRNREPKRKVTGAYIGAAKRVFGQGRMEDWLDRGHVLEAACWLKTIYWESGVARTPEDALLGAYDLMPGVERPPAPTGR